MAKYLFLKHYRGAPASVNDVPMDRWTPAEIDAHLQYMNDFADRLKQSGEYVDSQALSAEGAWVRSDGGAAADHRRPLPRPGPDCRLHDRRRRLLRARRRVGRELSAAPGAGGEPIHEWLEVRPFMASAPTVTE